jgi:formate/nitrite transporter
VRDDNANDGLSAARSPVDAYTPQEIAFLVEQGGVRKAHLPALQTVTLGLLAGAYIAFGGMFCTLILADPDLGFAAARLLGGLVFSLGLVLVVIGGAELFTGNNLIVIAWADGKVSSAELLRNWSLVYVANFAGALVCVALMQLSGGLQLGGGAVADTAAAIATTKLQLPPTQAFFRGILCNALVCLAIWMSFASHSVTGKIMAIAFPISAFVALGFEHSIANMYLIPIGMLNGAPADIGGFMANLLFVTLGNIVGGSVCVAAIYWIIYVRPTRCG